MTDEIKTGEDSPSSDVKNLEQLHNTISGMLNITPATKALHLGEQGDTVRNTWRLMVATDRSLLPNGISNDDLWIVAVTTEALIARSWDDNSHWKWEYTMSEDGSVAFSGFVRVRPEFIEELYSKHFKKN